MWGKFSQLSDTFLVTYFLVLHPLEREMNRLKSSHFLLWSLGDPKSDADLDSSIQSSLALLLSNSRIAHDEGLKPLKVVQFSLSGSSANEDVAALASASCCFIPIISFQSLLPFTLLKENSRNESLLLWETAIRLHANSSVAIFPIWISAKQSADDSYRYQKLYPHDIIFPNTVSAYSKELSGTPLSVNDIVRKMLSFPPIHINPQNVFIVASGIIDRGIWSPQEEIGPEPFVTCVQCDKSFKHSQNADGICQFHRGFVRGSEYLCCGLSAYDKNAAGGCALGRHRAYHHSDYTYEAYFFWDFLSLRTINYETREVAVIRIGRILPHHPEYGNLLYIFLDPNDEFLPHRLQFKVISPFDATGFDSGDIIASASLSAKATLPNGREIPSNMIRGNSVEIDGVVFPLENRTDGFVDLTPRFASKFGQMCQVSWVRTNGLISGVMATCQTATSTVPDNKILNLNWPGVNSKYKIAGPSLLSAKTMSSSSFGEKRNSRPYNIPSNGIFESGPQLLLPEPRNPEKFESVWRPFSNTARSNTGIRMKVQSISILRNRFSSTEDQVGISLQITNLSDHPIVIVDKAVFWRFRFPPNCIGEIFSQHQDLLSQAEQESTTWKPISKSEIEAYEAKNAASVPLGISGENSNHKALPVSVAPFSTTNLHLRFLIKYPWFLKIRQSWSTETRFRSHLVRRGPVLLDLELSDSDSNLCTLTAEVSWTADPQDILPGTGKNKRGDENQILHRCDDVFAHDRMFIRLVPLECDPKITVDRPVFKFEGAADSSIPTRVISEVDLRRAVLRSEATNKTEMEFFTQTKLGLYNVSMSYLIDRNCRRVFAVKTFIEMLAPSGSLPTDLALARAKSNSIWLVPNYGDSLESEVYAEPSDELDLFALKSNFRDQPIVPALFPSPRSDFVPRLPLPIAKDKNVHQRTISIELARLSASELQMSPKHSPKHSPKPSPPQRNTDPSSPLHNVSHNLNHNVSKSESLIHQEFSINSRFVNGDTMTRPEFPSNPRSIFLESLTRPPHPSNPRSINIDSLSRVSVSETLQSSLDTFHPNLSDEIIVHEEFSPERSSIGFSNMETMMRGIIREEIAANLERERELIRSQVIEPVVFAAVDNLETKLTGIVKGLVEATWTDDENRRTMMVRERTEIVNSIMTALDWRWGKMFNMSVPSSDIYIPGERMRTASGNSTAIYSATGGGNQFASERFRDSNESSTSLGYKSALTPSVSPQPPVSPVDGKPIKFQTIVTGSNMPVLFPDTGRPPANELNSSSIGFQSNLSTVGLTPPQLNLSQSQIQHNQSSPPLSNSALSSPNHTPPALKILTRAAGEVNREILVQSSADPVSRVDESDDGERTNFLRSNFTGQLSSQRKKKSVFKGK
ncbi:hypothetical protein HK096_009463 [Nowakowskiella sp. JEL0078]|nr:hypothetical protein HK096_009463 [Nowakowskiella sp. JEL0078]